MQRQPRAYGHLLLQPSAELHKQLTVLHCDIPHRNERHGRNTDEVGKQPEDDNRANSDEKIDDQSRGGGDRGSRNSCCVSDDGIHRGRNENGNWSVSESGDDSRQIFGGNPKGCGHDGDHGRTDGSDDEKRNRSCRCH